MQVTELRNEGLKREYQVVLPISAIHKKVDERLQNLSKTVKIKGFRPGKVPMDRIKKIYQPEIFVNVLNHEISESMGTLLKERQLQPVTTPELNVVSAAEDADIQYTLTFEVHPQVPEIPFEGITLKRLSVSVEEKDLEQGLKRLAEHSKEWIAPESKRAARLGDTVVIDFKGSVDGTPFKGGEAEKFNLELGSNRFIPGYEEQLVGVKEGDQREVKVTFPENYFSKELAGKEAVFAVTVHEILESKLPVIDDEFAKKMGFDDIAALHAAIKEQLVKEFGEVARVKMKKELFDQLDAQLSFEIPEAMVRMEEKELLREGDEAQKGGSGLSEEEKNELHTIAIRRVKLGILMAEIALKQGISVTNEELRLAVQKQAARFRGQEYRIVEYYQKNKEALKQLQGPILEEKVIDFLFDKAIKGEESITIDALKAFNESGESE